MLYNASLWLHIIGISLMAGTTVVDFMLTQRFWTIYNSHPQEGILAKRMTDRIRSLITAGILLILISGVGMMIATRGAFGTMLWFRIKMILVFIVIVNGVVIGRRLGLQLKRVLVPVGHQLPDAPSLSALRRGLNVFHISQLILFLMIFLLSTFKFN
jgi:hypothetical protein